MCKRYYNPKLRLNSVGVPPHPPFFEKEILNNLNFGDLHYKSLPKDTRNENSFESVLKKIELDYSNAQKKKE